MPGICILCLGTEGKWWLITCGDWRVSLRYSETEDKTIPSLKSSGLIREKGKQ